MLSKWITTTLGDKNYFDILGSGLVLFEGIKDYLSTSSVNGLRIEYVEQEISYLRRPSRANMQPIPNSVWFAKMKNTMKVLMADTYLCERAVLSTGFCGIHSEQVSSSYLKQIILSKEFNDQKDRFAEGSTQEAVSTSKIKLIRLAFPQSQYEQTKIAEVLSTVDRAIEQTEALIAKQQRIKIGLMQDLLTRGIDEHGNLRSEQTHQFKDSPLGRIPVEWEVKRLGESSEVCNSFRKPIAALVRENMKGDYPYYGPTGILDYIDEYRIDGKFVLIGEDGDHFLKFKTQEMTLLVEGKYNVNNHAHILRGKANVLTEWLHLFFLHRDITLHLTRQGAGRLKMNKAALLELLLSVPKEPAEQDRILKVMNTLRQNHISSIENLAKLRSLKTALMQDLLTGKKRVTALLNDTEKVTS